MLFVFALDKTSAIPFAGLFILLPYLANTKHLYSNCTTLTKTLGRHWTNFIQMCFFSRLPVTPVRPAGPVLPVTPAAPGSPESPVAPVFPEGPVLPVGPVTPLSPVGPGRPAYKTK